MYNLMPKYIEIGVYMYLYVCWEKNKRHFNNLFQAMDLY